MANNSRAGLITIVPVDPKTLPQDPQILQKMLVDLTAQLDRTESLLRQLLAAKTGRKSEQLTREQLALFAAEAGLQLPQTEEEPRNEDDPRPPASPGGAGRPRGRKPLPRHLKRERVEHDLAENEKHCAACGQDLRRIGEEVSERYEYEPAQMIVAKFADRVPLHRQGKIFQRHGIEISDQTMCGWMAQCAALLEPPYRSLKRHVLDSKVVGTDDTPVKVLDRKLRQTRKGRIWPYVGDRNHPAVIYDYTAARERAGPEAFLKEYRGHLQADAYVAYDSFFTDPARASFA